ncbi:hypothetical protein [Georgenia ruanii]|uniref:hypothetical protein n=1 Tax=Georgenia ruanii TaxID=348442 RepID=UPI001D018CDC|nr:hypothetical protein [Georgenia ruanii]
MLPTFAVIVATGFDVLPKLDKISNGRLLHGSQEVRVRRPISPVGELSVVSESAGLQDQGGGNAIVPLLVAASIATPANSLPRH